MSKNMRYVNAPPFHVQSEVLKNDLAVVEGSYVARLVASGNEQEVNAYQQLRHGYFVCRKGWVKEDVQRPGHETDRYDAYAQHLAVFQGEHMLAYLRVLPWREGVGYMLEHEFMCLLDGVEGLNLIHTGAVELSRLVLAPCLSGRSVYRVVEVLLKLLYHLSLAQQIQHYYIVVEEQWIEAFPRRFYLPFQTLGNRHVFPDGTATVAGYTTRIVLEQAVASSDPAKFRWYRQLDNPLR